MKKFNLILLVLCVAVLGSACTKQVVFLDRDINTTKADFDKFVKSTGYDYKYKDDVNNIYNVHLFQYNLQYLLQSKPIVSQDYGFTCKFKSLGCDTLMDCKTYPSNTGIWEIRRHLKEQKWEDIKYISYKKYQKLKEKGEL
jgi:hypothetical protein